MDVDYAAVEVRTGPNQFVENDQQPIQQQNGTQRLQFVEQSAFEGALCRHALRRVQRQPSIGRGHRMHHVEQQLALRPQIGGKDPFPVRMPSEAIVCQDGLVA